MGLNQMIKWGGQLPILAENEQELIEKHGRINLQTGKRIKPLQMPVSYPFVAGNYNTIYIFENNLYLSLAQTSESPKNDKKKNWVQISNTSEVQSLKQEVQQLKEENGKILDLLHTTFNSMSGSLGRITNKLPEGGKRKTKKQKTRKHKKN